MSGERQVAMSDTAYGSAVNLPDTDDTRYVRFGFLIIVAVFGVLGAWMALAPLESAAIAPGTVSVEGKKKVVQHLEGGIVEAIYVKDGDRVAGGQLLLKLDETRAKAQVGTVLSQYYEALALENRLVAERDKSGGILFDPEILALDEDARRPLIEGQTRLFEARSEMRKSETAIMRQRIAQLDRQIEGYRSLIASKRARLQSYLEEIEEWKVLYEEQLTDKLKLRELQRDAESFRGDIAASEAEIARLQVQINETKAQTLLQRQEFDKEVSTQLREVQTTLADLRARLSAYRDTLKRTKILSPVDGIVVGMDAHTISGVIAPGKTILEVIPESDDMVVVAKVRTTDIDKVVRGLKADVRFSAFNLQMAHVVEGEVVHVSADALVDEMTGAPYYEAEIKLTDAGRVQLEANRFFLVPGMPAEVIIKTGERTVLSYLLRPFRKMFAKAFRED